MNSSHFTPALPDRPGDYAWKYHASEYKHVLYQVEDIHGFLTIRLTETKHMPVGVMGGLWCRMVPEQELTELRANLDALRLRLAHVEAMNTALREVRDSNAEDAP